FPYNAQPSTFRDKWPALQVIGKDILVPAHGIYWLIMLHAIGFPDEQMPQLLVHGWWNLGGAKMSKSAGNIIDPFVLADKYSADAVRYYLISDIATGQDADFAEERLIERYNADLANSLGNLLNRSLTMLEKYRTQKLVHGDKISLETLMYEADRSLFWFKASFEARGYLSEQFDEPVKVSYQTPEGLSQKAQSFEANRGISVISEFVTRCNRVIDEEKPWSLAKDSSQTSRLDSILYSLAESLRIIAILISLVLPKAAHGIFDQLNWKMELSGKEERLSLADAEWGGL